ncbi:hypothetical protein COOONC_19830 [Cooperia oncophora]
MSQKRTPASSRWRSTRNNCVVVGSVKQANRYDDKVTDEDRRDIWERYEKLQPAMKLVHHYGHGGHGFTVGWGTAIRAAALVERAIKDKA